MYTNYNKMGAPTEELDHIEAEEFVSQDNVATTIDEPMLDNETATTDDILLGNVVRCAKLNVRKEPIADAMIVGTLSVSSEVMIDEAESTEDFYKVCTASGMEGYCVKEYITIQ